MPDDASQSHLLTMMLVGSITCFFTNAAYIQFNSWSVTFDSLILPRILLLNQEWNIWRVTLLIFFLWRLMSFAIFVQNSSSSTSSTCTISYALFLNPSKLPISPLVMTFSSFLSRNFRHGTSSSSTTSVVFSSVMNISRATSYMSTVTPSKNNFQPVFSKSS